LAKRVSLSGGVQEAVEAARPLAKRVLLVGESNPFGSDPRYALYPLPWNATGGRLCKILHLSFYEYLEMFDRVNLLYTTGPRWSAPDARIAAQKLTHRRRVLLGAKVCAAHGIKFYPFRRFTLAAGTVAEKSVRVLVLPHSSGRCRIWNDVGAAQKARRAVQMFVEEV
jgi:hypothetical protein